MDVEIHGTGPDAPGNDDTAVQMTGTTVSLSCNWRHGSTLNALPRLARQTRAETLTMDTCRRLYARSASEH